MDNSIKSGIFTTICLFFYVIFHFFVLSFDFEESKILFERDYMAKMLKPPSTTATVPVTNDEASLMR